MGTVISFGNDDESSFASAAWVGAQFFEDLINCYSADDELCRLFESGIHCGGVSVELLNANLQIRVAEAMQIVARATIDGTSIPCLQWSDKLDDEGQEIYREKIAELLKMIDEFLQTDPRVQ